jgi:hypothetical protein
VDFATLILSAAALVISLVALYVASLRRANIVVNPVEDLSGPEGGPERGRLLEFQPLWVPISIWNTGAQGGILQGVVVADLELDGTHPWSMVSTDGWHRRRDQHTPRVELPIALEAGEVESVYLLGRLYHGDPHGDPEDHARGIRHLGELRMKLEWTYLRTERSRRTRFRKCQVRCNGEREVTIDGRSWKHEQVVTPWAQSPGGEFVDLVDLATGVPAE